MAIKASCLCGSIQLEIGPPYRHASHCHCKMCRKGHGAAHATYLSFRRENLKILEGTPLITYWQSSENVKRKFCGKCGSNLFFEREGGEWMAIAMGILDDDPGITNIAHIYADDKASWAVIPDDALKFGGRPSAGDRKFQASQSERED